MLSKFFTRALLSSLFFIQLTPYALSNTPLKNAVDDIEKDILAHYRYGNLRGKSEDFFEKETATRLDFIATKIAAVDEKLPDVWPNFKIGDLIVAVADMEGEDYYAYNFRPDGECWKPMTVDTTYTYYKHTKPDAYIEEHILAREKSYREAQAHLFATTIWFLASRSLSNAVVDRVQHRFNDHQHAWKYYSSESPDAFGDTPLSPDYLELLHLEDRCLSDFMKTKETRFLEDYVALRKFRQFGEGHSYEIYEKIKERQEGTITYVKSAVLALLDPLEGMEQVRQRWSYNQLLFFKGEELKKEQNLLWERLQEILEKGKIALPQIPFTALLPNDFKESAQEAFLSGNFSFPSVEQLEETAAQFIDLISSHIYEWPLWGRATFTGAAVCWALQFLNIENWQQRVEEGLSPSEVLDEVLVSSIEKVQGRVDIIKERYDFSTLSENVHNLMACHSIENIKKGYAESPGMIIKLYVDDSDSYRKHTFYAVPYIDLSEKSTYYRNAIMLTHYDCELFGESLPWVVIDNKEKYVEMKVPSVLKISINRVPFDAANSTEDTMTYSELEIEGNSEYHFSLHSGVPGNTVKILKNGSRVEIDMRQDSTHRNRYDL